MVVKAGIRFLGLCTNAASVRVRARSAPSQQFKQTYNSIYTDENADDSSNSIDKNFGGDRMFADPEPGRGEGNRVMVVVDSSFEAKCALQWALSHTVHSTCDSIVLLHVTKPSKRDANSVRQRANKLLCSMKDTCQMRRPGVQVETAMVEGADKGAKIVEEAKKQRVSLLVLGQRKRPVMRRLQIMWSMRRKKKNNNNNDNNNYCSKVVEYCIQNSNCMTVAVRRKSNKYGGYLITTQRHKNFWLLA